MKARERFPKVVVGALVFNKKGEALLLKTHKWGNKYGLAGGKVRYGETLKEAVKREVLEETGLAVSEIEFFIVQQMARPKEFYKDVHFIAINFLCKTSKTKVTLNEESEEYVWVKPEVSLRLELNAPTREFMREYVKRKSGKANYCEGR
ncbi:Nucleoside triphosphatase NudI [uncultured archaeon]|nr:Nucleoside triphosphatase NudI [uncultured archaeon]